MVTSTAAGSVPDDFAGSRGFPEITANLTAAYRFGRWSIQLQQRYVDEVLLDRRWVEGIDIDDNAIQSKSWTNLVLGYGRESAGGGRFGTQMRSRFPGQRVGTCIEPSAARRR